MMGLSPKTAAVAVAVLVGLLGETVVFFTDIPIIVGFPITVMCALGAWSFTRARVGIDHDDEDAEVGHRSGSADDRD